MLAIPRINVLAAEQEFARVVGRTTYQHVLSGLVKEAVRTFTISKEVGQPMLLLLCSKYYAICAVKMSIFSAQTVQLSESRETRTKLLQQKGPWALRLDPNESFSLSIFWLNIQITYILFI